MIPWEDVALIALAIIIGTVISRKLLAMNANQAELLATATVVYTDPLDKFVKSNYPGAATI